MSNKKWTRDPIPSAHGHVTIRRYDGSETGCIDRQPIAVVYHGAHADLIAAAPELARELKNLMGLWEREDVADTWSKDFERAAKALKKAGISC